MKVTKQGSRVSALAVVLLAGVGLTACTSSGPIAVWDNEPRYPIHIQPDVASPIQKIATSSFSSSSHRYDPNEPYEVYGVTYTPHDQPDYDQTGMAAWRGAAYQALPTSSGEFFDMKAMSAAHTTLPLGSIVEVTNLDNGKKLQVRINDRGPFAAGRIIDVSRAAAEQLGMIDSGTARVRVRYVGPAPKQNDTRTQVASNEPSVAAPASAKRDAFVAPTWLNQADAAPPVIAALRRNPTAPPQVIPAPPESDFAQTPPNYEVQAGAFANLANAQRAQATLANTGEVLIKPVERDGSTLYRVVVSRIRNEDEALRVVGRMGGLGFPDARVIKAF